MSKKKKSNNKILLSTQKSRFEFSEPDRLENPKQKIRPNSAQQSWINLNKFKVFEEGKSINEESEAQYYKVNQIPEEISTNRLSNEYMSFENSKNDSSQIKLSVKKNSCAKKTNENGDEISVTSKQMKPVYNKCNILLTIYYRWWK